MSNHQDGPPAQSGPTTRPQQMQASARSQRAGERLPQLILLGGAISLTILIVGIFIASLSPSATETGHGKGEEASVPATNDTAVTAVLAAPGASGSAIPPATPAPPVEPVASAPLATASADSQPQSNSRQSPPIALAQLVAQELAAARRNAVTTAQAGLREIIDGNAHRLHTVFLPGYLSFIDRKLAELKAYNLFALDWVIGKLTGQPQDRSTPSLIADFEAPFLSQVVSPIQTRQQMTAVGNATASRYAADLEARILLLQQSGIFAAEDWQALPPLSFTSQQGQHAVMPVTGVSATDPRFLAALSATIGNSMGIRFERSYRTLDITSLTWPSGESIFNIGRDAWIYYGTFVVYWIGLFLLLRLQLVPINVFGALIGWMLWEVFSWSSWLGYEWLQYEQTRNALEPVIVAFAEDYFAQLAQIGADMEHTGAFRSLHQIETAFAGR